MSALSYVPIIGNRQGDQQLRQQAAVLFDNVFAGTIVQKISDRLAGRPQCLVDFSAAYELRSSKSEHDGGVRDVPLHRIVGSEGRACDFRPDFRPRHARTRSRWISVAAAVSKGVPLPPVELTQLGDDYYVRDGHHRISVARANGQDHIDAHITVLEE